MLHIATAITSAKMSQPEAKRLTSKLVGMIGRSQKVSTALAAQLDPFMQQFAKDCLGTPQQTEVGDTVFCTILTGMEAADIRGVKADVAAFLEGPDFAALPEKTIKPTMSREVVKADEFLTKHDGMTVREFRDLTTAKGIKVTFDRGVTSAKIPGVKGVAYFSDEGALIDLPSDRQTKAAVLAKHHAGGKLKYLAGLNKLTAAQIDFIGDCMTDPDLSDLVTPKMVKAVEKLADKRLGQ